MSYKPDFYFTDTNAFEKVVIAAEEQVGIPFDPGTKQIANDIRYGRRTHGQAQSGQLDIQVEERKYGDGYDGEELGLSHRWDELNEPFRLRGLLRDETGYLQIHLDSEHIGPLYPWGIDTRVKMSVISSARAINRVQELLGRAPGKDAIKLTTTPGRVRYTPGEWIESFGDGLQIGISDTSDWDMAEHDREPFAHMHSWIATPSQLLQTAAVRAREIKAEYGVKIHLPKEERPKAVDSFAGGLEQLSDFTREPTSLMLDLGFERTPKPPLHHVYNWINAYPLSGAGIFRRLGIIAPDATAEETTKVQWEIRKQYVAHLAKLSLRLDEVKPEEYISKQTQAARTKMLQLAIDKCE
jgi:hypothetical protein